MNCAVNIGDARVQPGDILRGDADTVIPKEREEEILSAAEEIDRIEAQIRHFVNEGMTPAEARKRRGTIGFRSSRERPVLYRALAGFASRAGFFRNSRASSSEAPTKPSFLPSGDISQ